MILSFLNNKNYMVLKTIYFFSWIHGSFLIVSVNFFIKQIFIQWPKLKSRKQRFKLKSSEPYQFLFVSRLRLFSFFRFSTTSWTGAISCTAAMELAITFLVSLSHFFCLAAFETMSHVFWSNINRASISTYLWVIFSIALRVWLCLHNCR